MATDLKAWRGRNDDGTETTATWKAAQNVSWTQLTNTNFRIRFLHQQSVALVNNLDVQLQYSLDNSVWTNVSASSLVIRSSASANLADAANLTSQLTGGTGTFIGATAFDEVDGICGGNSLDVTATGNFETEFSVQLRDADVFNGATVYIRTINSDTATAWTTYSGGVASLTVSGTRKGGALGADALGSYADSAPTIDLQGPSITPITNDVSADAWGTLGDSTPSVTIFTPENCRGFGATLGVSATDKIISALTTHATQRTWAVWVYYRGGSSDQTIFSKTASLGAETVWFWKVGGSNKYELLTRWSTGAYWGIDSPALLEWHHYAITYDYGSTSNVPLIYKDGIPVTVTADVSPTGGAVTDSANYILGNMNDNLVWDGMLSEFAVWNRILDSAEIAGLGQTAGGYRGKSPLYYPTGLVEYIPLNDAPITSRILANPTVTGTAVRVGLPIDYPAESLKTAAPSADALGSYADTNGVAFDKTITVATRQGWVDSVTFNKQDIGVTLIPVNVPADSLGLYADQTPVIDKRGILTAAPAADSVGLYTDITPTVDERGFLTIAPSADSLGLYADQAPAIDRRGFLTAAPAAESLGLYADATPTISKIVFLTANIAADSLGLYADQAPIIDKQVISTTPISRDVPADSLGLYADQQPTFYETGAYSIAPSADSLGLYTDATPLIDERGFLSVAPPADSLVNYAEQLGLAYLNLTDSLGLYADAAPAIDKRGYLTAAVPTDSLGLYADQTPIVDKQTIATTPITRDVPGDSLGLYADQTPTIDERAYLTAAPGADSLGLYADTAPIKARYRVGWQDQITVDKQVPNQIAVPVPADSLGLYADATPPLRIGYRAGYPLWLVDEGGNYLVDENGNPFVIAGLVDTLNGFGDSATIFRQSLVTLISVSVPADSLGLYADQAPGASKIGNLIANVAADSLGLYADQAPAFSKTGALAVNVPADSLGLYADQTPVLDKRGIITVAPAADSLANYAERLGLGLSVGTDDFNQWLDTCGASTTGLLPKLFNIPADALDNYGEQFGLGLELRGDLMTMADQAPAIVKTTLKTAAPTADAMSMGDQAAAFTVGKSYVLPTEGLPTYSEILARSVGLLIGLSDAKPIHLDSAAASEFGFIVAQFIDQNEGYADAAAVLYLGFDELAAMVTDPLANWADALAVIRNVNALKLSGKIVDSVALSGKVIEEKVSLNGKVFDTSDLSGELYTGD